MIKEGSFKMIPQFQKVPQTLDYTDHAWLDDDRIVAGTQSGELVMLENFEIKQHIDSAFNTGGLGQGIIGEDGKTIIIQKRKTPGRKSMKQLKASPMAPMAQNFQKELKKKMEKEISKAWDWNN